MTPSCRRKTVNQCECLEVSTQHSIDLLGNGKMRVHDTCRTVEVQSSCRSVQTLSLPEPHPSPPGDTALPWTYKKQIFARKCRLHRRSESSVAEPDGAGTFWSESGMVVKSPAPA